ncbi:hypothetical protein ECEC1866_4755 [Escherichia coli EC1866]|nr:hypothetical protein ECFRIK1997_5114 [Escherichia coli FRIK1997]EKJ22603.1 hypothetical protein ECEC1866_4755 [Escherichia coli EC1866]
MFLCHKIFLKGINKNLCPKGVQLFTFCYFAFRFMKLRGERFL